MTTQLRPMLAAHAPEDLEAIRYPILASPKLDGIRVLIVDGVAVSRTLKPLRNRFVQSLLGRAELNGLDGEIIVGPPNSPNAMQSTTSGVMSYDGEPDFRFYMFDRWTRTTRPFESIQWELARSPNWPEFITLHPHTTLHSAASLEEYESAVVGAGYEGVIVRDPNAGYKFGRSTLREGGMLKLKRYAQSEAVIIGVEERMHNANEPTLDERGYTKRSSHQENKIPTGVLGALVCRMGDVEFNVGTGFDDNQRAWLWENRASLPGKIITFKHFTQTGVKGAPRHPVFISFRDRDDL